MGFIAHYRGHLRDYAGLFDESLLIREVTLDEFLDERYPRFFLEKFTERARADRDRERDEVKRSTVLGDSLWLWRRVDPSDRTDGSSMEWGGLAVKRAGKVIRVWLVWQAY
jgi:hypothetical protein